MQEKFIIGIIGIITGFLGALLKSWIDTRLKLDEDTRKERWQAYKRLWELMKDVPMWPRNDQLTYRELLSYSMNCRDWYFLQGGYHLSGAAQRAYRNMQETVTTALKNKLPDTKVEDLEYNRVQESCSALRTQLTLDLRSRLRGALYFYGA